MRKSLRALCVVVALSAALLLLVAVPALATSTHVFSTSFGEAGSGDGQLSLTESTLSHGGGSGVAVNSSTHDVYVADTGNHRIDEFSASGAFVRAWGWGVADGSTEALQSCTSGCHAGLPGGGPGQLDEPTFLAVDNSGGPSEGDVYVADRVGAGVPFVTKFTATGGYLSRNDGSEAIMPIPGPFGRSIGGIAVDASGDLWVLADDKGGPGDPRVGEGIMFEFAQDGSFITDWDSFRGMYTQMGLAIDSVNDLYLLSFYKFDASGTLLLTSLGISPYGLAVDTATNDLFVDEGSPAGHGEGIGHYVPGCELAGGFCAPADIFGASGELSRAGELAVDSHDDTVYVADIGHQRVAVFGRTPDVTTGQLGSRTPTTATLSGTVNPDNTPIGDCHFDYVADSEYNPAEADPYASGGTAPCDVTPAGASASTVHATITGLTPGAIYHFRLEATNVYGTSFGADVTGPGMPPAIESSSADGITSSSAEFHAVIDPEGGETTYRFEYGTDTSYGAAVPVPDGDIGSSIGVVPVSRHVQGLAAGTTYHFRVVAHNLLGSSFGPDRTITTQPTGVGTGSDSCPNAALRAQQLASALPDCRAYEQVSPAQKNGSPILGAADNEHVWQSAPDGSAVTYTSSGVFAGGQSAGSVVFPYLSSRTQDGWSTHNLLPPQALGLFLPFVTSDVFSSDLTKSLLFDGAGTYGQDDPPLVAGEPANNTNLFRRDNSTGSYQLMNITPPGVTPSPVVFQSVSASADLSHVVFADNAQLTADSPPAGAEPHLYDWSEGAVRLLGILPNGTPVPASLETVVPHTEAGNEATPTVLNNHAISTDGSRIFFEVKGFSEGNGVQDVYLRQGGSTTVQVDASHGSGPGGGGSFVVASSDGSRAFITADASSALTNDTAPGSGTNLYRYDTNAGALTDLTPAANAEVQGVLGASEDGSYIYFVANGVLASGASPGNCVSTNPDPATNCDLYLYHAGTTTFIASLNGEDLSDWYKSHGAEGTAIVSPDGRYLAFQSLNSLTGYDNLAGNGVQCGTDTLVNLPTPQPRCTEVFVYDAASGPTGHVSCASCNPSGGAPSVSSLITAPPSSGRDQAVNVLPRYLSDSGQLFFNSLEALVPRDTNRQWDVYEYEPGGIGSCQQAQGCDALISSGTSRDPSVFRDASSTGEDVFFTTTDRLVAQDGDTSSDLYDAKVNGGIASQNEVPTRECEAESCKPAAAGQPAEPSTSSSDFTGAGNLTPAASAPKRVKPVKKKHKRPVRKKKRHPAKKKHHQKKRHRARGRRANYNRRGAK